MSGRKVVAHLRLFCRLAVLTITAMASTPLAHPKANDDARARLLSAAKLNGLNDGDVQPWQLKFTFKALDQKGTVIEEGVYEESWISQIQFRRSLTGTTHALIEYGTEKGVFRTGDDKQASTRLNDLHLAVLNPIAAPGFIKIVDVREEKREIGGVKRPCFALRTSSLPGVVRHDPDFIYYFDPNRVLFQASMPAWSNTEYRLKNSFQFQGHALPGDVEIWNQGIVVLTAHLESIEAIKQVDQALFQPPADAALHDQKNITLPMDVAEDLLLQRVAPVYPPIALQARVEGTVGLQAEINKEGRLENLRSAGGPPMLQQAAMDAVRQWVYRPYLVNGKPIRVEITILVPFSLSK